MSDRRRTTAAARPDLIFTARAEARALLWAACVFDLHEAIDKLQADAERDGLIAAIGQDQVQQMMSAAFGVVREHDHDSCLSACCLSADEPVHAEQHAAASTVEAVVYALRVGGLAALPQQADRLAELSDAQLEAVIVRLSRMPAEVALLSALVELLP